jgi:hypothetical protein
MPCLLIQGRRGDEVRSFKQIVASSKPNPTIHRTTKIHKPMAM